MNIELIGDGSYVRITDSTETVVMPYRGNELVIENIRLRADVERIGRELATMTAANAELNARLTLCEAAK